MDQVITTMMSQLKLWTLSVTKRQQKEFEEFWLLFTFGLFWLLDLLVMEG
jgi:hypothetical protein